MWGTIPKDSEFYDDSKLEGKIEEKRTTKSYYQKTAFLLFVYK